MHVFCIFVQIYMHQDRIYVCNLNTNLRVSYRDFNKVLKKLYSPHTTQWFLHWYGYFVTAWVSGRHIGGTDSDGVVFCVGKTVKKMVPRRRGNSIGDLTLSPTRWISLDPTGSFCRLTSRAVFTRRYKQHQVVVCPGFSSLMSCGFRSIQARRWCWCIRSEVLITFGWAHGTPAETIARSCWRLSTKEKYVSNIRTPV